jgi:hypothetical protein
LSTPGAPRRVNVNRDLLNVTRDLLNFTRDLLNVTGDLLNVKKETYETLKETENLYLVALILEDAEVCSGTLLFKAL